MTLTVSLSTSAEAELRQRAAAEGKDPIDYASQVLEEAFTRPTVDELLEPFRGEVAASRMSDEELDAFYEQLRDRV